MTWILTFGAACALALATALHRVYVTNHMTSDTAPEPQNPPSPEISVPVEPLVPLTTVPGSFYLWDSPEDARHSVRLLCDSLGLNLTQKNILCACIMQESSFENTAKHANKDLQGNVTSTDYGICQINDYFHIGPGKDFPSVEYVLGNPDEAVTYMIEMYKAGKLTLWVSFSSKAYVQWLSVISTDATFAAYLANH